MSTVLAFVAVTAVVIVTPGQDIALVIKNTLAGGRAGGIATALGIVTGLMVWVLATSAGLAALVVASERVFILLKLVGALYLVYLGLRALEQAVRGRRDESLPRPADDLLPAIAFRQGSSRTSGTRRSPSSSRASCRSSRGTGRFCRSLAWGSSSARWGSCG